MFAFTGTPLGRMLNAVRDNPERVEFIGYNTQRVRYLRLHHCGLLCRHGGGLAAINFEIVTAEVVGAALGRLPAVHLPGRRHVLLRAHHRRRADGAGLGAAVRVHQGLAAVPGAGLPVHGDVRARRHRQPDHDEPARGRSASCAGCGPLPGAGGTGWWCCWARRHDRDDLPPAAQCRLGPELNFLGPRSTPRAVNSWFGAGFVLLTGLGLFELCRRQFVQQWGEDPGRDRTRNQARGGLCEPWRQLRIATYALELRDLRKSFGKTEIIRGANLAVQAGERVAIIGPNGAGKSTLFNLISGRFGPPAATCCSTASASTA
jgi:branched-chain amino acid transport system permease protein